MHSYTVILINILSRKNSLVKAYTYITRFQTDKFGLLCQNIFET